MTTEGMNMDRFQRQYAVWAGRRVDHLMTDPSIVALEVAERYANGAATDNELASARAAAWFAYDAAAEAASAAATGPAGAAARAVAWAAEAAARAASDEAAWGAAEAAAWAAAQAAAEAASASAWDAARAAQAAQYRRIVAEA